MHASQLRGTANVVSNGGIMVANWYCEIVQMLWIVIVYIQLTSWLFLVG